MTSAKELERLVVRLVGEGKGYEKVLDAAIAKTAVAARKIEKITETEMAAHNAAMEEAARITHAVATPTERYAEELGKLQRLYKRGYVSQETYNRSLKNITAQLPSVQKAQAKYNQAVQEAKQVTNAVRTPTQKYAAEVIKLKTLHDKGHISTSVYNRALKEARKVLPEVQRAQAKHNREMQRAKEITNAARTPVMRYRRELAQLNHMHRVGAIDSVTHARSIKAINKEFMRGQYALAGYGHKLQSVGRSMRGMGMMSTFSLTLPIAGSGIASMKEFGGVNQAITESASIMSDVTAELQDEMTSTAREMSLLSRTSAKDLAESYYFLASAGLTAKQSITALDVVERFSVAGAFDMARATDLLTDAQSALGLTVKDEIENRKNMIHVSDVLVKANTLANASVEQFSEALTNRAAAAMRLVNKDVEEGVAVLAAYADQGLKGAAAGDALYVVSRDLQRAAIKNKKIWEEHGMSVFNAAGKMHSYANIIEQIEKKFSGLSDEQKRMMALQLGFQDRSFGSLQALMGLSDKVKMYEKGLREAGSTTDIVAKKQLQGFINQLKIIWNNVKYVSYEIGEILKPYVIALGEKVKGLVMAWRDLAPETKKNIVVMAAMVAIIGPVIMLIGGLVLTVGTAMVVLSAFHIVLGIVGTTFFGMAAKMGVAVLVGTKFLILAGLIAFALLGWADVILGGQLGFLDFVKSVRVGGYQLNTWFGAIGLKFVKAWNWAVKTVLTGWSYFKTMVQDTGGDIYRMFIRLASDISSNFWWAMKNVVNATTWLSRKIVDVLSWLGVMSDESAQETIRHIEEIEKKVEDRSNKAAAKYESAIAESLGNSEKRWEKHNKYVAKLNRDYARQQEEITDAIVDAFTKDTLEHQQEERDAIRKQRAELARIKKEWESLIGGFQKGGGIQIPDIEMPDIEMPSIEMPSVEAPKADARRDTNFMVTSLRRFSFAPLPETTINHKLAMENSAKGQAGPQEVKDSAVAEKLDMLIGAIRERPVVATLAR